MANITFAFNATVGTTSRSGLELSAGKEARLIAYLYNNFGPRDANGALLPQTNARVAQAFGKWADTEWERLRVDAIRWEQDRDAQAARAAVQDY